MARPMLDDLELVLVQEIGTYDRRVIAEHKAPGAEGSQLQNLGRRPTRIALWGVAAENDVPGFADNLETKFRAGRPLDFVADIATDTTVEKVLIDDLQLQELAGKPERIAYVLSLRQFIEPQEPEDPGLVDAGLLPEAAGLLDQLLDGLSVGTAFFDAVKSFTQSLAELAGRLPGGG